MGTTTDTLPTIYTRIEDRGWWDSYHCWHRDTRSVEWSTEPIEGVDYGKPWHGAKLEPSKRLLTIFSQGYSPGVINGLPTLLRADRQRLARQVHSALIGITRPVYPNNADHDCTLQSKLTADEYEYLTEYLLGFTAWSKDIEGNWRHAND